MRIIDLPAQVEQSAVERVIDDISRPDAYLAVGYDEELTRRIPRPRIQDRTLYENRNITWTSKDVFLVTGGAKGITAECALALARVTGVKMALVGSSPHPQDNPMGNSSPEISRILRRFRDEELTCQYYQCNVADARAVAALVERIETDLGNITGIIHGAASNKARRIENCSVEEAQAEIGPKVLGVMNLCQALQDKPPKMFAGISSIGAVVGLPGNSWHSFSNEVLDLILRRFAQANPQTSVLSIAYSVWAEVGMGARMGTVRNLGRMGIKAIPKNEGVNRFVQLIHKYPGDAQVVITSSLGGVQTLGRGFDTWRVKRVPPPVAFKFIEKLQIIDPGIEIIARTHLSLEKDSYVKDHVYKGSYLFPTVFSLEAMAQIVAYTVGQERFYSLRIEDIRLERPIVVDPQNGVDIELHTQVLERESSNAPQRVFVEIRTEQTGFAKAHFSANFVLEQKVEAPIEKVELPIEPLYIQPKRDLYSWLLFQGLRFQRLEKIYTLNSTKMVFRTQRNTIKETQKSLDRADGPFLLGDPYYRDSLLQSVQPMVPQDLGLPIGINSIQIYQLDNNNVESCIGVALGEGRKGKEYNTTVFSVDENGRVIDKLEGYHLRMISHRPDHPTAEEIANPGDEKERLLHQELMERSKALAELKGQITTQKATIASLEAKLAGEKSAQQATIERNKAELRNAQTNCERYQNLYQQGVVPSQQRDSFCLQRDTAEDSLKEAQANLDRIITTSVEQITEAKANLNRTVTTNQKQIKEAQATLNSVAEVRPVDVQLASSELEAAQANVQRAQAELDLAYVRSPRNGRILKIHTWPGELIGNDGIVELGQTEHMYVKAEIYETDITKVRVGQTATIISQGVIDKLKGTVEEIGWKIGLLKRRQFLQGTVIVESFE
ncbi:MAG: SDR family NAD(P)-dependent oxidoreductase [Stigonema ocellatum SAG 48.90 = DSM 106950]|nr:SDR family NAD(P)-dependent oxidoreductase [Stigonema ocellatum SAG 48.90 = DSM 106950]